VRYTDLTREIASAAAGTHYLPAAIAGLDLARARARMRAIDLRAAGIVKRTPAGFPAREDVATARTLVAALARPDSIDNLRPIL